jgi:competence protein ComEC
VAEKNIRYHAVAAGDSLVGLGRGGALVLHPAPDYVSNTTKAPYGLNNGSVVLRVVFEGQVLLLTGDIEHETDSDLLRWKDRLQAQILKAAHHGSRTSSTPAFIDRVRPDIVTVSCGVGNKFRHPAPEVIQRYQSTGSQVYRTDYHGAISLRLGHRGIFVETCLDK